MTNALPAGSTSSSILGLLGLDPHAGVEKSEIERLQNALARIQPAVAIFGDRPGNSVSDTAEYAAALADDLLPQLAGLDKQTVLTIIGHLVANLRSATGAITPAVQAAQPNPGFAYQQPPTALQADNGHHADDLQKIAELEGTISDLEKKIKAYELSLRSIKHRLMPNSDTPIDGSDLGQELMNAADAEVRKASDKAAKDEHESLKAKGTVTKADSDAQVAKAEAVTATLKADVANLATSAVNALTGTTDRKNNFTMTGANADIVLQNLNAIGQRLQQ